MKPMYKDTNTQVLFVFYLILDRTFVPVINNIKYLVVCFILKNHFLLDLENKTYIYIIFIFNLFYSAKNFKIQSQLIKKLRNKLADESKLLLTKRLNNKHHLSFINKIKLYFSMVGNIFTIIIFKNKIRKFYSDKWWDERIYIIFQMDRCKKIKKIKYINTF